MWSSTDYWLAGSTLISGSKCLSVYKLRKAISVIGKVSLAITVASVNAGLFTELISTAQVFPRQLFSHVILFPLRTYPCHQFKCIPPLLCQKGAALAAGP